MLKRRLPSEAAQPDAFLDAVVGSSRVGFIHPLPIDSRPNGRDSTQLPDYECVGLSGRDSGADVGSR